MAAEAQNAIGTGQFHLIAPLLDSHEIEAWLIPHQAWWALDTGIELQGIKGLCLQEASNLLDWPAALHLLGHIYSGNL